MLAYARKWRRPYSTNSNVECAWLKLSVLLAHHHTLQMCPSSDSSYYLALIESGRFRCLLWALPISMPHSNALCYLFGVLLWHRDKCFVTNRLRLNPDDCTGNKRNRAKLNSNIIRVLWLVLKCVVIFVNIHSVNNFMSIIHVLDCIKSCRCFKLMLCLFSSNVKF